MHRITPQKASYTLFLVNKIPDNADADGLPEWVAPPRMIGGYVAGPLFIERSENVVVVVRQVLAYPNGFEIDVEGHARGPYSADAPPEAAAPGRRRRDSLCFRLRLADGTEVIQDDEAGLRSGQGPMLVVSRGERSSGSRDNHEDVRMSLWIWTLPPPGPLTVACS
jgi:hypothetical protein